jgi:hypothetical protein
MSQPEPPQATCKQERYFEFARCLPWPDCKRQQALIRDGLKAQSDAARTMAYVAGLPSMPS